MHESTDYKNILRWLRNIFFVLLVLVAFFLLFGQRQQATTDWAAQLAQEGVLEFAVTSDLPPLGSVDAQGALQGLEVDLARRITEGLTGNAADATLIGQNSQQRDYVLTHKTARLTLARFTYSQAREKTYALTRSYASDHIALLSPNAYQTVDQLRGKTIGVLYHSTAYNTLKAYMTEQRYADEDIQIKAYASYDDINAALARGEIEGWLEESLVLKSHAQGTYTASALNLPTVEYVLAGEKADAALVAAIDKLLAQWEQDGSLPALRQQYGL